MTTQKICNIVSIVFTVVGAVFFIIGCTMHGTSFGADFYTYVYHGLAYIVQLLSFILMAIGLLAKCYFVVKNEEVSATNQYSDMVETLPKL